MCVCVKEGEMCDKNWWWMLRCAVYAWACFLEFPKMWNQFLPSVESEMAIFSLLVCQNAPHTTCTRTFRPARHNENSPGHPPPQKKKIAMQGLQRSYKLQGLSSKFAASLRLLLNTSSRAEIAKLWPSVCQGAAANSQPSVYDSPNFTFDW